MFPGLALGCLPLATGCLVAEAPEYGPAQQRPPVIQWNQVLPSTYALQVFLQPNPAEMDINVPFRSEDAGDDVVGTLWVDWGLPDRREPVWDYPVPASSFDDTTRSWSFPYLPNENIAEGCGHTLTLLLMHSSNYDAKNKIPKDNASWDVASVTWQLNVFPSNTNPNVVEPCETTTTTAAP